jgi:hypothetical protein
MEDIESVPECIRRSIHISNLSKGIVKSVSERIWWSQNIPYTFWIDEEGLQAAIQDYLHRCSY